MKNRNKKRGERPELEEGEFRSRTRARHENLDVIERCLVLVDSLAALEPEELKGLPLEDSDLRVGILRLGTMKPSGARQRLLRFLRKMMADENMDALDEAILSINAGETAAQARVEALETWRDRLVKDGDTGLDTVLERCPDADRQQLRQLVRQAQKEKKGPAGRSKAFRALFQALKALNGLIDDLEDDEDDDT